MSIADQNKVATDDAQVVQLEDASTLNTLGVTASNEAKVSVTQPLPAGTNLMGTIKIRDGSGIYNTDAAVITVGGIVGILGVLPVDPNLHFIAYSSQGQGYSLGTSTDDTNANAHFANIDSARNQTAVGNVASGATDSGAPVKVGGIFNTAFPTLTNGQRGDIQLDTSARQVIAPLTNTSIVKAQLQDNAGTASASNYGTAANALRVAAQIGNASAVADFNSGTTGAQTLRVASNAYDGAGTALTSTTLSGKQRLDVILSSDGADGSAVPTHSNLVGGTDGTNQQAISVDTIGRVQILVNDTSGNGVTSSLIAGTAASKRGLDVIPLIPVTNYYSAAVNIRQTAATAANATVWAMRNPAASTKTAIIERIYLMLGFDVATPLGRATNRYDLMRFTTATPTAGTAITVVLQDTGSAATQVSDVRFLDTGLTVTSVVFGAAFATISCLTTDGTVTSYLREEIGFKLAPGEGFCIRLNTVATIGQSVVGEVIWREA